VIVTKTNDNEHIYDENKRLKKELARVTQERDLLKKAAAYFAKESLVKVRLDKRASNRVFGVSYV
jgi:transposase-like protein